MAAKKKIQKKQARSKRTAGKKVMATKKLGKKRRILKKKSANKPARKKAAVKTNPAGKKTIGVMTASALKKRVREKSRSVDTVAFSGEVSVARSGRQSGDLQGLSSVEAADSESVDELLEEGNAFEAGAVKGVEDADDADEKEVRTHEVPEDDVPDRDKE
jgi:N utilization substance protein A